MHLLNKQRLIDLYSNAIYTIEFISQVFEISPKWENRSFLNFLRFNRISSWSLMTPENPNSTRFSEEENSRLRDLMSEELAMYKIFRSVGMDEDESYHEIGFFVANISREEVMRIGRKFNQNAAIFGDQETEMEVLWTAP